MHLTRATVIAGQARELDAIAEAKSQEIQSLLSGYRNRALLIAGQTQLRQDLARFYERPSPELATELAALVVATEANSPELIRTLSLIGSTGTVVASTDAELIGAQRAANLASSDGLLDAGSSSRLRLDLDTSGLDIVVEAPVEWEGVVVGIAEVELVATELDLLVQGTVIGETGELVVATVDSSGRAARYVTPVRRSPGAAGTELAPMTETDHPIVRALAGDDGIHGSGVVHDGVPTIAATRYLPSIHWAVMARIDRDEALGRAEGIRNTVVGLVVLVTVIAVVAGLLTRRQIRRALRDRERADAQFLATFMSSPVALLATDHRGRVRQANRAAALLFDASVGDLRGREVATLLPAGEGSGPREAIARSASGEVPVQVAVTPIDVDGDIGTVVAVVDLTERREAERVLSEQASALTRVNAELETFASAAAHDLKAPVRNMTSLAEFVLEDHGDLLPTDGRHDLERIASRGHRLQAMVEGLLAYARLGHDEGARTAVEADAVLDDVIDLYVPLGRFTVVREPLPPIHATPAAVELVLRNLLSNAVKHHDRDRGRIEIRSATDGDGTWFVISDDGPGVPEAHIDRVFQLFRTLEAKDRRESTGLGLTMARKAVEVDGGEIEIVPNGDERGTTFRIRWPLAEPVSTAADRIATVDDELIVTSSGR